MEGYKHILVPVDGSQCSERAIEEAKRLQASFGAKLTLLYVVSDPDFDVSMGNPTLSVASSKHEMKNAELYLKRCAESFEGEVDTKVVMGTIARKIIDEASNLGCDLIVMGSLGLGSSLRRFLIGSVSQNVLSNTALPVLIVH